MKSALILLLAGAAAAQKVVELGISRVKPSLSSLASLGRRGVDVATLDNNATKGVYFVQVTVGTPGQPQDLTIDTGSSDVWVVGYNADVCQSSGVQPDSSDGCDETYNPANSKTYKLIEADAFQITYVDGTTSSGDYFSDEFTIGNTTINSLQMGYATNTSISDGILGVGFSSDESIVADALPPYPNIIDQLVAENLIGVSAFSLYLNDPRSDTGSILFGGLDTDKFIGPLAVVPMIADSQTGSFDSYTVALMGISFSFANGTNASVSTSVGDSVPISAGDGIPAVLDSGSTYTILPDAIMQQLVSGIGAYTDYDETIITFADCDVLTNGLAPSVSLALNGTSILLTVEDLVFDVLNGSTLPPGIPFTNPCLFALQSAALFGVGPGTFAESGMAVLGDTVLRSVYVVYDQSHKQIGLAPANLNSTTSNIVEFSAADSGIPSATGVASQKPYSPAPTPTSGGGDNPGTGAGGGPGGGPGAGGNTGGQPPSSEAPGLDVFGGLVMASIFAFMGGALVVAS